MSYQVVGKALRTEGAPKQLVGELDQALVRKLKSQPIRIAVCPAEKLPASFLELGASNEGQPDYYIVAALDAEAPTKKRPRAKGEAMGE